MVRDTPSHGSDHLCLIWKESIHNCRWYRADTACGTHGRTDRRPDRRTEWNQYTPPTTSYKFTRWYIYMLIYTVQCHYNVVNIIKNIRQRHPIACPLWQAMGCHLWIQLLIGILPQFLQYVQCLVILDHVIMALYYSMITCLENQFLILSTHIIKLARLHQLLFVPPSNDRIIMVMKSHLHYWLIVKGSYFTRTKA